jgi:hydroquinone glucosyltransferase
MVHLVEHFLEANTILVNTFDTVEPEVITVLRQPKTRRPQVYPVGPLIFKADNNNDAKPPRVACLEWLDRKQARSDIFVSFGSSGALPTEQIRELALGLELSEQRFLWVVWSPSNDGSLSGNYHDSESKKDPFAYLPEGFLERTKDMGLVVPSWASQIEVLAHVATGGFLTHCGWNSTLESLVHGLPMVAWPLFVEQRLNAVMLSEGVGRQYDCLR